MSDSENRENKPKVLGLKGGTNTVRQSFSHGRSKSVVVETRKKKFLVSRKGPLTEAKGETVVNENEAKENEEIIRRKKAIEASKLEQKRIREQKDQNQESEKKETRNKDINDNVLNSAASNPEKTDVVGVGINKSIDSRDPKYI